MRCISPRRSDLGPFLTLLLPVQRHIFATTDNSQKWYNVDNHTRTIEQSSFDRTTDIEPRARTRTRMVLQTSLQVCFLDSFLKTVLQVMFGLYVWVCFGNSYIQASFTDVLETVLEVCFLDLCIRSLRSYWNCFWKLYCKLVFWVCSWKRYYKLLFCMRCFLKSFWDI